VDRTHRLFIVQSDSRTAKVFGEDAFLIEGSARGCRPEPDVITASKRSDSRPTSYDCNVDDREYLSCIVSSRRMLKVLASAN